ncbi:hypothetical protein [Nocardiopsis alba]|uniref:hypothetical protein n=1 Tax=Nocardiopsis alba TaxID=53437 RepID=UPI003D70C44E
MSGSRSAKGMAVVCCLSALLVGCSTSGGEEGSGGGVDPRVHEGEAPSYSWSTSVSKVAWEWRVPDEESGLVEALPGRSGAVMVLLDAGTGPWTVVGLI